MNHSCKKPWSGTGRILSLLLVAAFLGWGCGGGGGGSPGGSTEGGGGSGGPDLTGHWVEYRRLSGTAVAYEADGICQMEHSGSTLWLAGSQGTVAGSTVDIVWPNATAPDRYEYHMQIVSPDLLEGTQTDYHGGSAFIEDVRFTRTVAPTGTFSVSGTLNGHAVSVATSQACAIERLSTLSYDLILVDPDAHEPIHLGVDFWVDKWAVGAGGFVGGNLSASIIVGTDFDIATMGTVTISTLTGSRAVGTFNLTMTNGNTQMAGSFDLPILISW